MGGPGETMVKNDLKIQVGVGRVRGQCSHKHHDYRSQAKFPHKTHSLLTASSSCQDFQAQSTDPLTLHSNLPEKGHNQGSSRSSIPVLFESFPCTKERQFLQTSNKPFPPKPPSKCSEIQDGVCRQDSTVLVGTPMGHHCRSKGCLLPSTHSMGVPQVLCLRDGRQNLCLSVHALRPVTSPMGIYQGNKTCNVTPSQATQNHLLPPRRFSHLSSLPFSTRRGWPDNNVKIPIPRPFHKFQKVNPFPFTGSRIFGGNIPPRHPGILNSQGQNRCSFPKVKTNSLKPLQYSQRTGIPHRPDRFHLNLPPTRETLYPSPNQLVKRSLVTSYQGLPAKCRQFLHFVPPNLAGPSLPTQEIPHVNPYSYPPAHDRRQPDRMGWSTPPRFHIRGMVQEPTKDVNKLARAKSNPIVPILLSTSHKRKAFVDTDGQHYSSVLHKKTRYPKVRTSYVPLQEDPGILFRPQDHTSTQTSTRPTKCPSGLKVTSDTHRHRMVLRSDNFQYPLAPLWPFLYRPLRQQRKQQAEGLHLPISRPFVFRGERPFPPLGSLGLPVHFPTSSHDGRSAGTSTDIPRQRRANSPILCSIKVVPSTHEQMPHTLPSSRRLYTVSDDMPGNSIPQPTRVVQASRMATLRSALKNKGLSEVVIKRILKAQQPSTLRQYQSAWAKFMSFLFDKDCLITNVTLNIVCEFIIHQQDVFNRDYRTLVAYKSSLRLPLFYAANLEINCTIMEQFMRGVFKSNPPKKAKEMPLWSLNGLLTFLDSPQFEPLEKVDYKFLLQKTLTLLLLSSGRRIGEITALSDTSNFNREDSRLYLEWLPTFNPKHNSPTFRPPPPSIS